MPKALIAAIVALTAGSVFAMGRKAGDGQDIQPVQRGSPANPNSAYNPPAWDYAPRADREPKPDSRAKTNKASSQKPVPDAPAPDAFPDYTAPQPAKTAPPLAQDSVEPPLPDEPGGDPDKRPSK